MQNLFDSLPKNFFNYLSSSSQNRIYSDCLREIYLLYEQQISFRLPRSTVRNALSVFLLENHVCLEDEEGEEIKTSADMASTILRKFSDESVGWLEEETDDATYQAYARPLETYDLDRLPGFFTHPLWAPAARWMANHGMKLEQEWIAFKEYAG